MISKLSGNNSKYDIVALPQSVAADNVDQVTLTASIDDMTLTIDRTESRTGTMKETTAMLMTDEQEFEAYDKYLGRKKEYMEKVSKRLREGTKQQFAKESDEQRDNFKTEVELYHDQAAEQVLSAEILSTGIDPQNPAFAYRTRYTMDGWVKKAGNNLIVSVGKLIGSQAKVEGLNRNRTADVDRRSPGVLTWDINVTIPSGCEVTGESLEKLQQHVANSAGEFTSSATVQDGQLHLVVTKRYNHGDYPASQWQELLQVIDAADEFTTRQVVFKK